MSESVSKTSFIYTVDLRLKRDTFLVLSLLTCNLQFLLSHVSFSLNDVVCPCKRAVLSILFSRPYWVVRSRLWYDVLSVCRRLSVCNVLYCG